MQSETGFPSSHQLKSYVASKSCLKLAARAVLSADAGLLVCFSFFITRFCLVPCGRLSWLLISFWAHVNIVHRTVSYLMVTRVCVSVCVCLSVAVLPHYCTDLGITWGMVRGAL